MGTEFVRPRTMGDCPVCGQKVTSMSMERERIMVSSCSGHYEPDPNWRYVDHAGHVHTYDNADKMRMDVLEKAEDWEHDEGSQEFYPNGDIVCRHCGELIEPGTVYHPPSMYPQSIPGLAHFVVGPCRHEITPEQYEEMTAHFREDVDA